MLGIIGLILLLFAGNTLFGWTVGLFLIGCWLRADTAKSHKEH